MSKHFVVVGAGLGGLATALRLSHLGHRVTVLEKTDQVGGRNREIRVGGALFDAGPTLLMMLDPFRKLFTDVGERLDDHLELTLCDPSYRVFYADRARIEGSSDAARMIQQIEELSGKEDALAYPRLLRDLKALYEASIPNFVRKNFYSPKDFFGVRSLALVKRHGMLGNLAAGIARYFEDPRLRMLFSFQTMYLGLSPYEAPWVYAVLTYMEYGEGIWYPKGGVSELCRVVARLATEKGAEIRLNSPVARIEGRTVRLESGEEIRADTVICNADLPYAERDLLRQPRRRKLRHSCSAYMLYLDYEGSIPELLHHNVFFGGDFEGNLRDVFTNSRLPEDPAFYACISGRTDAAKLPKDGENLYLLIPCPNLDRPWTEADGCALRTRAFARLAQDTSFDPGRIRQMGTFSPEDWASELNLNRGAAFGVSHHFNQSAFFRPQNRSRSNPDLYFVGASTVPGNGLPMVLISAELVEERLRREGRV